MDQQVICSLISVGALFLSSVIGTGERVGEGVRVREGEGGGMYVDDWWRRRRGRVSSPQRSVLHAI